MLDQLLTPGYVVFTTALVVMVGIGIMEAIGLGLGHLDMDVAEPGSENLLDWLGLKSGLSILVWLTGFLACFAFAGVALQQIVQSLIGSPLHWSIATGCALIAGLVANSFFSGILAAVLPEYESTVIGSDELLRRRATVLEGAARRGAPARAKVIDYHGQAHYVMVEPHDDSCVIAAGETGMLVRREGPLFFVLPDTNSSLSSI